MGKGLRKVTAGILTVLLIIGSLQLVPLMPVRAEGESGGTEVSQSVEVTYTADQLKFTKRWSGEAVEMPYTFDAKYDEIWFQLPEAVNLDQCEGIIFRTADQGGELCVKLYDGSGTSLKDNYGIVGKEEYLITPGVSGTVTAIAIMANDENIASFSTDFVSITFKMSAEEEGGGSQEPEEPQSGEITYTADQLKFTKRWSGDVVEMPYTFSAQNDEIWFQLPEPVDMSRCEQVIIKTASQGGALCFKIYSSSNEELQDIYNCEGEEYSITPSTSEKAYAIGIMHNDPNVESFSTDFVSITFKMSAEEEGGGSQEPEEPQSEEITYTADQLKFTKRWSGENVELPYTFDLQDTNEIWFQLPEPVDMSRCEQVIFRTASQGGVLCFKIYSSSNEELQDIYNCEGKEEYAVTPTTSEKAYAIGIMHNDPNVESFSTDFVSITFKMTAEEEGGGSQEPEEPQSGEVTYVADQLKFTKRWSGDVVEMPYTFSAQNDEIWFQLPEPVDMNQCEQVIIKTASQGGLLCFKIYNSSNTAVQTKYNCEGEEYVLTPETSEKAYAIGIMHNDPNVESFSTDFVSITFKMTAAAPEEPPKDVPFDTNLIKNPDFADAEALDVWQAEPGGEVSAEVWPSPIYDDVTTYGKITGRTSNYNCFAQDVTEILEKGQEYQFTFWVMLDPEDYKDAPESQRTVEISPYITANGTTQYGSGVSGTTRQAVTPGEWVKFTGTYKPSWAGSLEKAVIRILEQGENYGAGDGVKGTYYVTGVDLRKLSPVKYEIEQDIPDLKDSVTEALGADTIVGTAVTASEMTDDTLMQLVTKHFNAVTLGNELKLDAMLGYATTVSNTETVEFNGQQLLVPVLDHSRADGMLDVILKWNQEHPDDVIRVRGHVLVWHSQAPKGFFRENYQADGELVSKEVMDLRLEWYIKTMLEYYTGENSKYKDLFYGWDVVNEAISDGTATYRSAAESDWAAIYGSQSSEYIIKAFRWANQYAPAGLELYYNDYNDSTPSKREGIVKLLQAVKEAEGTRIDGMGMQAHYDMSSPSITQFEEAARAYAAVVGKVQLTEMDFKASNAYDGTDATRGEEFNRQAYRYKAFYDAMKKLEAEGCDVSGITIWGVVDKYSWLQDSSSVGGGADGTRSQCPLLFDDYYKAKPSFWAFVDPTKLEPSIQKITVTEDIGFGYDAAEKYVFGNEAVEAEFLPTWEGNTVRVKVTVKDPTADESDSVTLYVDPGNTRSDSLEPLKAVVYRKDAEALADGYQAELALEIPEASITKKIGMDIRVADGDTLLSFNDYTNVQDTGSKYYAEAVLKPYAQIVKGTAVVDGEKESIWTEKGVEIPLSINLGSQVSATVTALWDEEYLYVFAEVKDALLNADSVNAHERDSLEVFIDENDHKSETYEEDDKQYRISYQNEQTFNGTKCTAENIVSAAKETDDGYVIEAAFKWTDIVPQEGMEIGFELQINDADETGSRAGTLSWNDETGMGWSSPAVFGTARLTVKEEPAPSPTPAPSATPTPSPTPEPSATPTPSPTPEPSATPTPSPTPGPSATPAPSPTPGPSATPVPSAAPASSAAPRPSAKPESEEKETTGSGSASGIAMPEQIKDAVSELEELLSEEDADESKKIEAVNEILKSVRAEAEASGLADYSFEAIEYTEEVISRALGKTLEIELVGSDMPQVSKVTGALLSAEAEKEIRLVLTKLLDDQKPVVSEDYGNGYAIDISLYADGEDIQPLVPVTIRMEIPSAIDPDVPVKVLHYGEDAEEPEILDARVIGGEIEFTTQSFSTFVVVNEMEKAKDGNLLGGDPVISAGGQGTGIDPETPEAVAAQSSGSRVVTIVVIVILAVLLLLIGLLLALKAKKNRM